MRKSSSPLDWKDLTTARAMPHGKSSTVRHIVDLYELSDRYKELAKNTKASYRSALNVWYNTRLPDGRNIFDFRVHKIDYALVDHFVQILKYKHQVPRIRIMCAVMGAAWKLALRHGRAVFNPWVDLRLKFNNERDVTWTPEQVELAINTSKELGHSTLALYLLLMYETGQRPWIDLRNLTWDNIEEREDADGTRYRIIHYRSSKTNIDMLIPITDRCFSSLQAHSLGKEYLFQDDEGGRRTSQAIHNQFKRVKRKAGLSNTLQFRDLRRTSAVELAEAGASNQEMRAIHGWKSDRMVNRYSRMRLQIARNAQQKRVKLQDAKLPQAEGQDVRPQLEGADEHKQKG